MSRTPQPANPRRGRCGTVLTARGGRRLIPVGRPGRPGMRGLDEQWLEENFPLGDGVADTTAWLTCPYCAARFELAIDPGGSAVQRYVEDCEACCRPCHLTVAWDTAGRAHVEARTEEET